MTPKERKSLAEQITANPIFTAILDDMERGAIEALIYAPDETRHTAQLRVQAIRQFRADLAECLRVVEPKASPV